MFLVDAGDALSPAHAIDPLRREGAVATARFILSQYAAEHLDVLALGDRDFAFGRATLGELAALVKFPLIASNIYEVGGDKPAFADHALVAHEGTKVLFLGLISPQSARMVDGALAQDKLRVGDPVESAKRVIAAHAADKPDLIVVLSQLTPVEERELADAVPQVQFILGGDAMGASSELDTMGTTFDAQGSQKGKHVGIVTVTVDSPRGLAGPLVNPTRRPALERKKTDAERRVTNIDKRLSEAKARAPTAGPPPPIEAYERQLAAARADLQLAIDGLKDLGPDVPADGNPVSFELVEMSTNVADEPVVKAAVDAFRVKYPDPTKAPPRPVNPAPPSPVPGQPGLTPGQPAPKLPAAPKPLPH